MNPAGESPKSVNASIFIGGLKPTVKRSDVIAHFTKYGEVKNVNLGKLPDKLNNRGFAFVKFATAESADKVLLEKQLIMGREVECRLSYGKKFNKVDMEVNSKRKLYVSELLQTEKNEDLQAYFSQFGQIEQAYIIFYPNTTISKCFGYVEFKLDCEAKKALKNKHQTWNVVHFKNYKTLQDNKTNDSIEKSVNKINFKDSICSDSTSAGSSQKLQNCVSPSNKGVISPKHAEIQQCNQTIPTYENAEIQEYNNYYNGYSQEQNNGYYDQQQYQQNQYYGYQQQEADQYYNYYQTGENCMDYYNQQNCMYGQNPNYQPTYDYYQYNLPTCNNENAYYNQMCYTQETQQCENMNNTLETYYQNA